uniref:Uncharacterized protein n=1 Tax=Timema monikensis TaxID=170555 RepID=A0A7R9HMT5_9NEOP|nr:unnamed protein product [Timema monikensis]
MSLSTWVWKGVEGASPGTCRSVGVEGASSGSGCLVEGEGNIFKDHVARKGLEGASLGTCRSLGGEEASLGSCRSVEMEGASPGTCRSLRGALERNMSLSGQYLEELSRRYKRQVEEMQRSLNRSLVAAAEDSRREEERDRKRAEEEAKLQEQLEILTSQVKSLMAERTSWPNILSVLLQHVVFLSIVVAVVLLVLQFLRRPQGVMLSDKHVIRRTRSLDGVRGHLSRCHDFSRTSSGQVTVSDTHNHLMLPDMDLGEPGIVPSRSEGKRRRRKRRDPVKSASINTPVPSRRVSDHSRTYQEVMSGTLPSRRASSSDLVQSCGGEWLSPLKDQYSALPVADIQLPRVQLDLSSSTGVENHSESSLPHFVPASEITTCTSPLQASHSNAGTKQGNGIVDKTRRLSSPGFMRTALSSRRSRGSPTDSTSLPAKLKSDNWEYWHSRATHISGPTAINGHHSPSTEESVVKKTSGLKKMVKKFF